MKHRSPDGMKWCGKCRADKPAEEFLDVSRGWRVTYCNSCARIGMAKWAAGALWRASKNHGDILSAASREVIE